MMWGGVLMAMVWTYYFVGGRGHNVCCTSRFGGSVKSVLGTAYKINEGFGTKLTNGKVNLSFLGSIVLKEAQILLLIVISEPMRPY